MSLYRPFYLHTSLYMYDAYISIICSIWPLSTTPNSVTYQNCATVRKFTGAAGVSISEVRGLHIFVPIAMYANVFHHAIPSLAQPVRDKASLHRIFAAA